MRLWLTLSAVSVSCLCVAARPEIKPAKINAKVLEYQDKVQDFSLELLNAQSALEKSLVEVELLRDQCVRMKTFVQKGFEHSNQLKGCLAAQSAAETTIQIQRTAVKTLTRNRDIWTIRLAAEAGETSDVKLLAEFYLNKWKEADSLVEAQIQNAKIVLSQAEAYYEWSKRVALKGYAHPDEYEKAIHQLRAAKRDLDTLVERQREIRLSLHEAEVNVAKAGQPS